MPKFYNVTILNPTTGRRERNLNVPAAQINFEKNTFRFNDFFPACEILKLETISDEERAAENKYFAEYGN
jgi:hypothetical protein